ncbi:MAG: NlpC/P60 family protein [Nocardioidaceae bacterium]
MTARRIAIEVATGWTAPDAPREIDAPAVADTPDLRLWTDSMGAGQRLGLHGRTLTQYLSGEPVIVIEESGDWLRVVGPWQPAPEDPRGYPAWVRRAHLTAEAGAGEDAPTADGGSGPGAAPTPRGDAAAELPPAAGVAADRVAVLDFARGFLGLGYLWGGTSPYGLDCSGLVHYTYRQAGVVVPRDAQAQHDAAPAVAPGNERAGDLYFFGSDVDKVTHVGFVVEPGVMLHAPQTGGRIELVELVELPRKLRTALVGRGRFLSESVNLA